MYFPFLNNKQSENLCLRTLSKEKKLDNVIPIINTLFVDVNTDWTDVTSINKFIDKKLKSLIKTLHENKNQFIIVINDTFFSNNITVEYIYNKLLLYTDASIKDYCIFGIYDSNISLTNEPFFDDKKYAILFEKEIVENTRTPIYNVLLDQRLLLDFLSSHLKNKIVITDSFVKKTTNKEYVEDDSFVNNFSNYANSGLSGFGDYTILPKKFLSTDGGNMNTITVATHLTYKKGNTLHVKHHTCTPEDEPSNTERVKNVIAQVKSDYNMFYPSHGLNTLVKLDGTSLGKLKELTMSHHIEKINMLLK